MPLQEAVPQPATSPAGRLSKVYYGWWIIAAGATMQFLQSALLGQAYGAYVVLLRDDFGWSKTALSAASSLREAESGVLGPVQGWLLDKLGPRKVAQAGVLLLALGFLLFSQVNSLLAFYGAFFVMSVGASLMGWLTITFTAVHWFERKRATAISLTSAGFAVGGMAVPLTVILLEQIGWRSTAMVSAVIVLVIGLPLSQLLKHSPAEIGLGPDGDPLVPPSARMSGAHGVVAVDPSTFDYTLREALRQPSFWWLSLGHGSALFIVSSMGVHLVSHLKQALNYSLGQASTIVFLMTLVFLIGTLSGGFVGDRISKRKLVVACMGMHAGGLVLLSHATGLGMVIGFVILHGLAWGWRGPQMAALRADFFGRSSFGKILGVSNMVIIIGSISGPLIAGIMYDITGDYRVGFDILAAIAAAGSIFFVLAKKPGPPVRA